MNNYYFSLEKYHGRNSRHTCPKCGRARCFTLYVDAMGNPLDSSCGKCDHENSCGYHIKPKDFLDSHPNARHDIDRTSKPIPQRMRQTEFLDKELVSMSSSRCSTFWKWIESLGFKKTDTERVFKNYHIGATRSGDVIFWQIDNDGNVHDGKIMVYDSNGHRSKDRFPDWVSSRMRKKGDKPNDYQTDKTMFGSHLICSNDNRQVNIVESEKTAILCSIISPEYIWIATGGCGYLNKDRTEQLKGRRITVFPDSGMYDKWKHCLELSDLNYSIVDFLESYPPNTDIADILLGEVAIKETVHHECSSADNADRDNTLQHGSISSDAEKIFNRLQEENPALKKLVDGLGLIPVGISTKTLSLST